MSRFNHTVTPSSVKELQERITFVVLPVAKRFNLTLHAFGKVAHIGKQGSGEIVLAEAWGHSREPAPMTPVIDSAPYDLLSGTIKAALKSSPQYSERDLVVTPNLALGVYITYTP